MDRPRQSLRALAALAALIAAPAAAQVREVRLTLDNDAFNFWTPPDTRPDWDYTSGVDASLEIAGGPLWARRLAPNTPRCDGREAAATDCASTTFALGQKLFTPRVDGAEPVPGQRPYAGWLYLSGTGRVTSAARQRAIGVEVGVTGPQSLGEDVHRAWHEAAGFWAPAGWEHQLAFEPGVRASYAESRLLAAPRAGGVRVASLAPEWGAEVGNVRTAAHVGLRARAGYAVPHPWSAAADRGAKPVSVYALAGARQSVVAHDLFLDGNTFHESLKVERRPLVFEYEVGGGVRVHGLTLEYRALTVGREYETQSAGHTYSTIELRMRPW